MKTIRKILILLFTLTLVFTLASCKKECKNHLDTNGDGLCEECGKEAETKKEEQKPTASVTVAEDGEFKYQFVRGSDIEMSTRATLDGISSTLKGMGVTISIVDEDDEGKEQECEILVGTVTTRGEEYTYDKHLLGPEGYTIKFVGEKILIVGGNDTALCQALEIFMEEILGIDEDTDELPDITLTEKDEEEYIQTDFDISTFTIGGADISEFSIAADNTHYTIASKIRDTIYTKSGKWLPIVSLSEKGEKSIVVQIAPKDSTPEDSFRVYVKGTTLYFECEYEYCFVERMNFAITKFIESKVGDVEYKQTKDPLYKEDKSYITYEQYGAKGDGKTNDFEAIRNAHLKANDNGLTVKGNSKATYYISNTVINGEVRTIVIATPTDWQGAKFIIDDSNLHQTDTLEQHLKPIFTVQKETKEVEVVATAEQLAKINAGEKLGPNTKNIDLDLGYSAMLMITNSNHKVYIRYGHNANDGNSQHELVVVDAEGNIKEGTELLLDYETVTKIEIYRNDCEELEIKNGTFTTIASNRDTTVGNEKYTKGFSRNLLVKRPNTLVSNITHYVEGEITAEQHKNEGLTGPCYNGFFATQNADNVTFKDCILTARRYYGIGGTYEFAATASNDVKLVNCVQQNYYVENADGLKVLSSANNIAGVQNYWGIGGTNYCKNVQYLDGCLLSRFDAHAGLYGGKIVNSHVGEVNLIGGGDFLIENSTVEDNEFISLRTDYGATWDGTITIKNSQLKNGNAKGRIVAMVWTNHDFGYVCHFPNLILDAVTHSNSKEFVLEQTSTSGLNKDQATLTTWGDYIHVKGASRTVTEDNKTVTMVNNYPMVPPEYIIVKNKGNVLFSLDSKKFFEKTMIRGFSGYADYSDKDQLPTK